jgi:ribosomal protein L32
MTDKTYSVLTVCKNCRNYDEFNIPIGKLVKQVLPSVKCLNCGCMEINHRKNMTTESIEGLIIPATWEEKDTDLVVQYQLYKKLNLKSVDELSQ